MNSDTVIPSRHSTEDLAERSWKMICESGAFDDLPYKIETNARGQIVMSPTTLYHGGLQFEIGSLLKSSFSGGKVVTEPVIETSDGNKIADAAWFSTDRWEAMKDDFAASMAPDLTVEVLSPSNTASEIEHKRALYIEAGAEEVWVCDLEGSLSFYNADGALDASLLVPDAPRRIEL